MVLGGFAWNEYSHSFHATCLDPAHKLFVTPTDLAEPMAIIREAELAPHLVETLVRKLIEEDCSRVITYLNNLTLWVRLNKTFPDSCGIDLENASVLFDIE